VLLNTICIPIKQVIYIFIDPSPQHIRVSEQINGGSVSAKCYRPHIFGAISCSFTPYTTLPNIFLVHMKVWLGLKVLRRSPPPTHRSIYGPRWSTPPRFGESHIPTHFHTYPRSTCKFRWHSGAPAVIPPPHDNGGLRASGGLPP
jgi:hypothetical protein